MRIGVGRFQMPVGVELFGRNGDVFTMRVSIPVMKMASSEGCAVAA
jgi:hypothetical protein